MIAGYDPRRIAGLDRHTRWALASLDTVTSGDVAADGAIAAIGRLRAVLAEKFVPAVSDIQATNPLVAGSTRSSISSCPSFDDLSRLQLDRRERTRWSDHDDIDLVVLLHIELTRQVEENGIPDPDDPFWADEFLEWVTECERRARADRDFARLLAREVAQNPLLGYIVAAGDFADDVLIAMTNALMDGSSGGATHDIYRDGAIQALADTISSQPATSLALLRNRATTERLLLWNRSDAGAFGLDGEVIGNLFRSALRHPLDEPRRRREAHEILRQLVDLAHGPLFDRGFPPGTAPGITAGLIGYLPSLLDSLGLQGSVFFENERGRFEERLGSPAGVVDLFGALMRDGRSLALLLAAIPALAVAAERGPFDSDAVNDYVVTLIEAADTEQIEEEIRAARTRAEWHTAIGLVSMTLHTALSVGGTKIALAQEVASILDSGARWLVDRITADELGMDDVRTTAFLLLTYGASVAFLDRRRDDGSDDDSSVAEATHIADEIGRLLTDDGSVEDLEREIRNLRSVVGTIGGGDALAVLDDPRITPAVYDATGDADLAD